MNALTVRHIVFVRLPKETGMMNKDKNTSTSNSSLKGPSYKSWDWITRLTGLAGFLMALTALWLNYQTAEVADQLKVTQLLDEAFDLMGGEDGKPLAGTSFIRSDSSMDRRNLELATRKIDQALIIDPDNSLAISYKGRNLYNSGRIEESIDLQRQAIKLEPNFPGAYIWLGLALEEKGDPDEALKSYKRALELNTEDIYALNNLGLLYYRQHKLDNAIEVYRKAIAFDPDFGPAKLNLGLAMASTGKLNEATRLYREVIQKNPTDCTAHSFLVKTLLFLNKPKEAQDSKARAMMLGCNEAQ